MPKGKDLKDLTIKIVYKLRHNFELDKEEEDYYSNFSKEYWQQIASI